MPGYLPLMALWLMAGGAPQGRSAAELMAAAKPAGDALAFENEYVRVRYQLLEYPAAERAVAESRPVVLYVKAKAESGPEAMTLLGSPRGGRLSWRTGAVPLGVRVEVLKAPPRTSAMRNPEADPPPGSSTRAEWDGGRVLEAVFEPMHFGDGVGPSPAVAIVLSDGVLEVKHDGERRRMGVRAGEVCWFAARTSLTVVSDIRWAWRSCRSTPPGRAPPRPRFTRPAPASRVRIDTCTRHAHHVPVLTGHLAPLVLAQAAVERGLLDSIADGLGRVKYQVELYAGQGNAIYVVIGAVVLLILTRVRRRH
jgi:hypothetical protein